MTGPAARPLVFLDVDGPLIPFRARPGRNGYIPVSLAGQVNDNSDNPLLDRLDPANGHRVDPFVGLTDTDFHSINRWLARLLDT